MVGTCRRIFPGYFQKYHVNTMVYECGNHPLTLNHHHWTIVIFRYFGLIYESFLFIAFQCCKNLWSFYDFIMEIISRHWWNSKSYYCFPTNVSTIGFKVLQKLYDFRLRHNFDCLISNNDSFSTSKEDIKCSGMPVQNINLIPTPVTKTHSWSCSVTSPDHCSLYKYITCGRAFWREGGLVSLCSQINTSTSHTPPKTIHPAFEISMLWDENIWDISKSTADKQTEDE